MSEQLPEPEGWLARAAIGCLREWKAAWGPAPFYLTDADIRCLEDWIEGLRKAWHQTANCLARDGIDVTTYPVKAGRDG